MQRHKWIWENESHAKCERCGAERVITRTVKTYSRAIGFCAKFTETISIPGQPFVPIRPMPPCKEVSDAENKD